MSEALTIILALTTFFALYAYLIYFLVKVNPERRAGRSLKLQVKLPDYKLLHFISEMPDGIISVSDLVQSHGFTKKEAKLSLSMLVHNKVLKLLVGSKSKRYYELIKPIDNGPFPKLSEKPFLTLGDLMILFKHFNYRLSLQDLCLATKLPVAFLIKEMKYFIKEDIVEPLTNLTDRTKTYILKAPYRNNPQDYVGEESRIDLDLLNIYQQTEYKSQRN